MAATGRPAIATGPEASVPFPGGKALRLDEIPIAHRNLRPATLLVSLRREAERCMPGWLAEGRQDQETLEGGKRTTNWTDPARDWSCAGSHRSAGLSRRGVGHPSREGGKADTRVIGTCWPLTWASPIRSRQGAPYILHRRQRRARQTDGLRGGDLAVAPKSPGRSEAEAAAPPTRTPFFKIRPEAGPSSSPWAWSGAVASAHRVPGRRRAPLDRRAREDPLHPPSRRARPHAEDTHSSSGRRQPEACARFRQLIHRA